MFCACLLCFCKCFTHIINLNFKCRLKKRRIETKKNVEKRRKNVEYFHSIINILSTKIYRKIASKKIGSKREAFFCL